MAAVGATVQNIWPLGRVCCKAEVKAALLYPTITAHFGAAESRVSRGGV